MDHESVYDGYVEQNSAGAYLAFLADLPGCAARAGSEPAAIAALTAAIPGYFDWLRTHDEYTPLVYGPFRVAVGSSIVVPAGHQGGFFAFDSVPMTTDDLEWRIAILEWTYEDLAGLTGAAAAQSGGGDSPADLLRPLVRQQLWLLSRLDLKPTAVSMVELTSARADQALEIARANVARLRSVSDDERRRVCERDGEQWSLRKALRCAILNARGALAALSR